jgi:hypothetical protein
MDWICDQQLIGQIITYLIQYNVGHYSTMLGKGRPHLTKKGVL